MRKPALALALALALGAAATPASAQPRPRWDTQLIARIQAPGYPASAYPHPNGRVYVGTYANPNGDALPSRVFEFDPDKRSLLRSWALTGQDLAAEHGVQAATSDAAGRLVLLDRSPPRALILDTRTGEFARYSTFADLAPCATGGPAGSCSPTMQDLVPMPNYAAWGPGGELYVTDFQQGVVWRVPPGGGPAVVWLADRRLDGQQFGTTGIALAADRRTLIVGQGSSAGLGSLANPSTGKLYKVPIGADGAPGEMTQLWQSGPTDLPDGFGIARSGRIYVALLRPNQIGVVAPDGTEIERFPAGTNGQNRSPAPFDSPSSAKFHNTRLMVPNQSYLAGDTQNMTLLDVETGEPGLPEYIPPGAGGVDSSAPVLSRVSLRPASVRGGTAVVLRVGLSEAARLTIGIDQERGVRWRRAVAYARPGRAGDNAVPLSTRIKRSGRRRPLAPGSYRVVFRATDAAGNVSRTAVRFLRVR
jgi:sugar lactone lactonase YvrE